MLFSSTEFVFYFLPLVLAVYFLLPFRARNAALLISSLFFYFWGEQWYVALMIFSTLSGWFFGLFIERFRGRPGSRIALIAALAVGLGFLFVYKYSDFCIANINSFFGAELPLPKLKLPIGISFYTFQILSYDIDLYRGQTRMQKNPATFATYVTLFPQLIAGPIVRYSTVAEELERRSTSLNDFAGGARRFILGLGKKMLLSNVLGRLCEEFKVSDEQSVLFVWLYIVAYALHIYFDFSGYSDMAIGLGRIFGFRFLENFNFPYISKTVTEFWRRWHISLGTWFRDYVYIPMGGNRVKPARYILNIVVVWFLTGFWHGAGWNFILWGLYFAVFLLLERFFLRRLLERLPRFVSHIYLILLVLISWALFDAPDLTTALVRIGRMFGVGAAGLAGTESIYYLRSYLLPLLLGILAATPLPRMTVARLFRVNGELLADMARDVPGRRGRVLAALEPLALGALLVLITACIINDSFNPFIYFRF